MKSDFLTSTTHFNPSIFLPKIPSRKSKISVTSSSSPGVRPDPWSLSDSNPEKPKPRYERPKHPLSDDDARRIIKKKAQYLSTLRRNQGSHAMTPKWIKRTPEQMVQYLEDDRNGQMYGKHVVAAIKTVRGLSQRRQGSGDDMRFVMSSFVTKLSFRDMCVVLKEQRGWRQVRDFFSWMKLQLSYRPSVVVYTIVLRLYGQVGKIKMAEETFLEMLEVGCEPDAVACGTMLCTYARWGRHNAMLTFYKAVQERRIVLASSVYNFMMSSLQKKSLHEKVIDLWLEMVEEGVPPTEFTYTLVVSSYAKQGFNEDALETFGEMKSLGFVPEEVTYSSVIGLSLKAGDWDQAVRLYEDMRSQGIVPSNYTCASMLSLYYKTENYPKALSLFADMERNKIPADEVIRGLIIRIYGKLGLFHDAQSMFEETERLNLLAGEKTYLAMSQVHLNSGNVVKALDVIEMMKTREIPFSRFAFIVMLQCYAKIQNVDCAEEAFRALSKTGLPDASSCNDMLNLYTRLNLGEKAKVFIKHIMADQVHFDIELYKTAMRVYCKEGMVSEAIELVEKMSRESEVKDNRFVQTLAEAMHIERNKQVKHEAVINVSRLDLTALGLLLTLRLKEGNLNETEAILKLMFTTDHGSLAVNRVIISFVREGDVSKAEILADLIIELGLTIEEETVATLIAVYGRLQKLKEAKRLYRTAEESKNLGKSVISSMIDAYVRCGWLEDAYGLFMESAKKGCDPGAVTISILVNALTNRGKHREAEHISQTCLEKNMELDTVGYNTLIKAMLEAGKLQCASEIYERMHNAGVPCSIQTYNTMISVYGRGLQLDKAIEVFSNARRSGLYLDEKVYTNMIMHYGKAGKMSEALALFTEMQKKGIKPGAPSYNMMVKTCASSRLHREVDELLQAMERSGRCTNDSSSTYLSLVQAYAESSQYAEAEKTITLMQEKGIPLSHSHFSSLLFAFAKAGMMDDAERIYCKMSEANISPDSACKRTILKGYMSCGNAEKGILFYEKMIRSSVEDDRFVSSVVQDLYKAVGTRLQDV
ncbi:PREDICTED: pentatricopeptide repeat-containing protein At5g27270 isoform X1 [Camelina sativa]|uniref:Pentatricopeptide repeat-containing protein At5g27270 isoform X1 n=2 Tax=Camelina sativa TaxID=90675 RepID=A0ABM0Y1H0_CAMSA|nr:PREDICTED: pentatricopeptide repeat-containing protein At5g27270 isoform X1 [Camelina sativa]